MASLKADFTDFQPRGEEDQKGWLRLERGMRVTGVAGMGTQKLKQALMQLGMPAIGDEHPSIADLYVVSRIPESRDNTTVDVRIVYERRDDDEAPADYADIEIGSVLSEDQVDQDRNGNYLYTTGTDSVKQGHWVRKDSSQSSIRISRTERGSPGEKSRLFVGKVNSGVWRFDPVAAARSWKCVAIVGNSRDGGAIYRVNYEFQYDADLWNEIVHHRDPTTGGPLNLDGLTSGQKAAARKLYEVNDEIDFNLLGLI